MGAIGDSGRVVDITRGPFDPAGQPAIDTPNSLLLGLFAWRSCWGVNDYIRDVADRLADSGFVTVAPVLYWGLPGRIELNREEEFGEPFGLAAQFDNEAAMTDATAVLDWLRARPEVAGGSADSGSACPRARSSSSRLLPIPAASCPTTAPRSRRHSTGRSR